MLVIRQQQLDVLFDTHRRTLVDNIVKFLAAHDASARQDPGLREFVEVRIDEASADGMSTNRQFATWITAAWLLRNDFDLRSERRRGGVLWPQRSVEEKVEQLAELIRVKP